MAAPTVVSASRITSTTSGSHNPTYPAGIQADDILLILYQSHNTSGTVATAITPPSPYSSQKIWELNCKTSGGTNRGLMMAAWKVADGTESGTSLGTVSHNGATGAATHFGGAIVIVRGADTDEPFEASPPTNNPNYTATVDWPSITTSANERTLVTTFQNSDNVSVATSTNWTAVLSDTDGSGSDGAKDVDKRENVSTGTYDPANGTATSGNASGYVTAQIAFKAPPAGQNISITAVTETDTAQALSFTKQAISKTLTSVTETDVAQTLGFTVGPAISLGITAVTETDVAQALSFFLSGGDIEMFLTPVTETDVAQLLSFTQQDISRSLTAATETDVAQALAFTQQAISKTLISATETDVAQTLGFTIGPALSAGISAVLETDVAQALSFTQGAIFKNLVPVLETDVAQPLDFTGGAEPLVTFTRKWFISRFGIY